MPTTLDDPIRPLDRPLTEERGDGVEDLEPLGPPIDRFPRRPRSSIADAMREALRPRGLRGKTPFELQPLRRWSIR
jgi:hypothetical protein